MLALLTDGDIILNQLDQTLFPGVPTTLEAHSGFLDTHSRFVQLAIRSSVILELALFL